jgi:hypothetical protein
MVGHPIGGALSFVVLAMALGGCGRGSGADDDPEKRHIRRVVNLAREYAAANKKLPNSIEELKNWAVKEGNAKEEDFISTRDKQPYKISNGGMAGMQVYEQTGKKGMCYIFIQGGVAEMSQEQVANMTRQMGPAPAVEGPP